MDLEEINKLKHIHFTGIKGIAMTNLALCMKGMGKKVTGSDVEEVFVTDEVLKKNKIKWKVGFGKRNLKPKPDLLVTTAAHGGFLNPEVKIARKKNIPIKSYAEFMSDLANTKKVISVCGVGGKTTTASLIATLLDYAKLNPSYVVGVGKIFPLGFAGRFEKEGEHFVCEADDYVVSPGVVNTPKFMLLNPFISVVTNIEYDHPDVYKNFNETKKAFKEFFSKIPKDGVLIASSDNQNVTSVIKGLKKMVITYGTVKGSDFLIKNIIFENQKTRFDLYDKKNKKTYEDLVINVPGKYNIQNATAAFIVGKFLKIEEEQIRKGLARYRGCRRRFEKMGKFKGAIFYDDYAHHPTEIKSILKAVREWFPKKRIVAIFQPHTFSRTRALFNEFSKAFTDADVVGLMDIYASARESFDATISSKSLTDEVKKYKNDAFYLGKHKETLKWINENVKKGDIILTMGAGDIFHLYDDLPVK